MVDCNSFNTGGDAVLIKLTIPGEPCAKGRPRLGKWGTYTPDKTVNYENLVKQLYISEHAGEKLNGALHLTVKAYFKIPKSTPKKNISDMIAGKVTPTKKPDIDNIIKIIGDSLNGIAYDDDSQIVTIIAEKFYSDNPRVELTLSET